MGKIIWVCSECDEEYADKETLKYHQKECVKEKQKEKYQNESQRFKCPHCDKNYTIICNLNRNIRDHHRTVTDQDTDDNDTIDDDVNNSTESNQVAKGQTLRTNVTRHVLIDEVDFTPHAESKLSMLIKTMRSRPVEDQEEMEASSPWPCKFCNNSYPLRSNMMTHISATHGKGIPENPSDNSEYPWPCDQCGVSFLHRNRLMIHLAANHNDSSNLKQPPEKHVGQKYCPFCKKEIADVLWFCRNAHHISNSEELLFFDGAPPCSKEELENEHRYSKGVCRLCKSNVNGIQLKATEILSVHYAIDHKFDEAIIEVIKKLWGETEFHAHRKDVACKVSDGNNVVNEDSHNGRVIYKCKCGVSVESYEECVQHSQDHLVAQHTVNKECDICKYRFEATALVDHVSQHDGVNIKGALVVNYDFETLLIDDWFEVFNGLPVTEISKIILSPYRHTRRIRMHLTPSDDENICSGGAVYQCLMCDLFVDPAKIENHCTNFDSCAKNKPKGHRCGRCSRLFYSADALANHTRNRDADFNLVKFNDKKDAALNNILENLKSLHNNPQEAVTRGTEDNVPSSGYSTRWYCKTCQEYVDDSVVKSHPHSLKILIRPPKGDRDAKVPKKREVKETVTRIEDGGHGNDNDMDIDGVSIEKRGRDVGNCDSSSNTKHKKPNKKRKRNSGQSIKKKLEIKIRREILEAKNRKAASVVGHPENGEAQTLENLQRILEGSKEETNQKSEDSENSSGKEGELQTDEECKNSDCSGLSNQDVGDSEADKDHEDASQSPIGDEEAETNEDNCQNPEDNRAGMEVEQNVHVTEQEIIEELLNILDDNIVKEIPKDVSKEPPEFSEDEYSDKDYSGDNGNENEEKDAEDEENRMQSTALDLLKQYEDFLDSP